MRPSGLALQTYTMQQALKNAAHQIQNKAAQRTKRTGSDTIKNGKLQV